VGYRVPLFLGGADLPFRSSVVVCARIRRCVVSEERARCALVRFELTADGLGPVQLGMTREDAGRALADWGECQPFRRTPE
jgi:hypothetical protein